MLRTNNGCNTPRSAYVHVPFCKHRCGYCNFTLVAKRDDLIDQYIDCLAQEIERQLVEPVQVDTLFLGGGTPTHLSVPQLERLLALLEHWLPLSRDAEFSCEANPLDCTTEKLSCLTSFGVNRLSLGGQSFNDAKLKQLERDHSGNQLSQAIQLASDFFANLSLDLIFAAPSETLKDWQQDLLRAVDLPINHLSTYGLTIEPGANFWGRMLRGDIHELDSDIQLAMYHHTMDALYQLGWQHYEVSNFCKPGLACRHNQAYWHGNPWFAFGPGASSFLELDINSNYQVQNGEFATSDRVHEPSSSTTVRWVRATNHRSTTQYIRLVQRGLSPVHECDQLSLEQVIRERLVFGLRQLEGVDMDVLGQVWHGSLEELFQPYLDRYVAAGWLERTGSRIRLTRAGLVISDGLWPDLLG